MLDVELPGFLTRMPDTLLKMIREYAAALTKPFLDLSRQSVLVIESISMTRETFKWEYVTEPESGLQLLKSKKDTEALCRMRKLADELL